MFGPSRKKILRDVLNRVGPIFKFDLIENMGGVLSEGYFFDNYVLGFYSSTVHFLSIAASGVNPVLVAQDNAKYNKEVCLSVLIETTEVLFENRSSDMLRRISLLMNNGVIVDTEFRRGINNGKKYVFMALGFKILDKDSDIKEAEESAKVLSSLNPNMDNNSRIIGALLHNLFLAYVIERYGKQ